MPSGSGGGDLRKISEIFTTDSSQEVRPLPGCPFRLRLMNTILVYGTLIVV